MAKQIVTTENVQLLVHFTIVDFDGFDAAARACTDFVRSHEPGTLLYSWNCAQDRQQGCLLERYVDTEAFRQHLLGPVFTEHGLPLQETVRWQSIDTFGEMPGEFFQILGRLPISHWHSRHSLVRS